MAGEQVKTLQCPNCAGTVAIHLPGQSVTVVCGSCSSILDPNQSAGAAIVKKYEEKARIQPEIPFGSKGDLAGQKWMCIGMIVKQDVKWKFTWKEYLLFNPKDGFRWLTEGDRHWTLVTTLPKKPAESTDSEMFFYGHPCLNHQGRNFRLFHRGESEVTYCLGEFYWRVVKGEHANFADYVRAGEMISVEKTGDEQVCSYGIYIPCEEIQRAFKLDVMAAPFKSAPHEPSNAMNTWKEVKGWWLLYSCSLIALLMFFVAMADSRHVAALNENFTPGVTVAPFKLGDFTLPSSQNVDFELYSPVDNNWFEVSYTVVNKKTGDSIDLDQGVEYYYGRDSDGSWTEGSRSSNKMLSALPEGDYELLVQPTGPTAGSFNVKVLRDVPIYSNFIWCLLALASFPLFVLVGLYYELSSRWSESDYSPFASEEE